MADTHSQISTSEILDFTPVGMTEHVVVFEVLHSSSRWWAWCFVDLGGAGFSRIRWSRPGGQIEEPPDGLEFGGARNPARLFDYDTPVVAD